MGIRLHPELSRCIVKAIEFQLTVGEANGDRSGQL
jgi:hypothetical protein